MKPRLPLVLLLAAQASAGCGEAPETVRIGDAVPRSFADSSLLDVIAPLLHTQRTPHVVIAGWNIHRPSLDVAEAQQARAFVEDPSIIAVVGHAGSKGTLLAAPVYREAGMPVIAPTATADELRAIPGIFLLAPSNGAIGAFLADAALDSLGGGRIALMHVADAYGNGIARAVEARLAARGLPLAGSAVMTGRECQPDRLAGSAMARALVARARPDVVILALSHHASVCMIRQLVALAPDVRIIASDSYVPANHADITAAERRAVHSLRFWEPGTDTLSYEFIARFREATGRDPEPGQALAYDAYRLLRQAVEEGVVTRAAMMRWLEGLGSPGRPAFEGVTGPIHFRGPRNTTLRLRHLGAPEPAP